MDRVKTSRIYCSKLDIAPSAVHAFVSKTDENPIHKRRLPIIPGFFFDGIALDCALKYNQYVTSLDASFLNYAQAGKYQLDGFYDPDSLEFKIERDNKPVFLGKMSADDPQAVRVSIDAKEYHLSEVCEDIRESGFRPGFVSLAFVPMLYAESIRCRSKAFAELSAIDKQIFYDKHRVDFFNGFYSFDRDKPVKYIVEQEPGIIDGNIWRQTHHIACAQDYELVFSAYLTVRSNCSSDKSMEAMK